MNFFIQKLIYDLTQGVDGSLLRNPLGYPQWTSLLGITFIEKSIELHKPKLSMLAKNAHRIKR